MRARPLSFVALVASALVAGAPAVRADGTPPRCRLERIDPSKLGDDRLRVYASLIDLDGTLVEPAPPFTLKIDGKAVGRSEKRESFASSGEEVYVALVIEVGAQYKKVIDQVQEALKDFLQEQGKMRVTLVPFGSDLPRVAPFRTAPLVTPDVEKLSADDDSTDLRMTDAVRLALGDLNKIAPRAPGQPAPRRLIVLLSDGLNAKMDRATFRKLGDEARHAGVPIHAVAFSPIDERGPLLNLGELSKRSYGTFRWARAKDGSDLPEQLKNLGQEVKGQHVLTFKVDLSSTEKHTFQLQCGSPEVVSNKIGGKDQFGTVASAPAGMRWWWWALIALGVLVGLYLLLAIVYAIVKARAARTGGAAAEPRAPKAAKPSAVPRGASVAAALSGTLVGVTGPLAGKRFPVAGTITIGKGAGHAITVLGDGAVSTNHCEIRAQAGGFVIRDLGSTNGTYVNGRRLDGAVQLLDGSLVRLGQDTQFKFRVG